MSDDDLDLDAELAKLSELWGLSVPDRLEEIVGWRYWKISRTWSKLNPPVLKSEHGGMNESLWPTDDWFYARCNGRIEVHETEGGVPGVNCTCGIYAARDRREFISQWGYHRGYVSGSHNHLLCMGEVGLAGKVIPGEKAHRAAKARPLKLLLHVTDWKIATALEDLYNVPVELTNLLRDE